MKHKKILLEVLLMGILCILALSISNKVFATGETYTSLIVKSNEGVNLSIAKKINLILGTHESETLKIAVKGEKGEDVINPVVDFKSSDETVVTVSSEGVLQAKKEGTATITVTGGGQEFTFSVNVAGKINFTNFENAKIEVTYGTGGEIYFKVDNLEKPEDLIYYCITSDAKEPDVVIDDNGKLDLSKNEGMKVLNFSSDGNIITETAQYNNDMYLWIYQDAYLSSSKYYSDNGTEILDVTKLLVKGQKLERPENKKFGELFSNSFISKNITQINLNVPSTGIRTGAIKIGKITDTNILNKIKEGKSDGFANLEVYAKSNSAIYEKNVKFSATGGGIFLNCEEKIDLSNLLDDNEYYYIYIILDDENGKYYPIEHCLTLAQAYVGIYGNWSLFFLGHKDFEWKQFSIEGTGEKYIPGNTGTPEQKDDTIADSSIPLAGKETVIILAGLILVIFCGVSYFKNKKYSDIK